MLHLGKPFGAQRLEAACERALAHDSPYYRTVKTILATGADLLRSQPPPQTPSAYGASRFVRDAASLFDFPQPQQDLLH